MEHTHEWCVQIESTFVAHSTKRMPGCVTVPGCVRASCAAPIRAARSVRAHAGAPLVCEPRQRCGAEVCCIPILCTRHSYVGCSLTDSGVAACGNIHERGAGLYGPCVGAELARGLKLYPRGQDRIPSMHGRCSSASSRAHGAAPLPSPRGNAHQ